MLARLLIPAAVLAGAASAADGPCAEDVRRFCEGKTPIEILSCLQGHQPDLADACKRRIDSILVNLQNAQLDCEEDAFGYCREVGPGEAMANCLSKQQGKLTRRCQSVFDEFARREAAYAKACSADARRVCPDKKAGKGDLHVCLLFRAKDLSADCKQAVAR